MADRIQTELLVVAAPPVPLLDLRPVVRGDPLHVDDPATVRGDHAVMPGLHPLDPEDLVLAAPVLPLRGVGPVGGRDAFDLDDSRGRSGRMIV
jgi:hypothetical protein